MKRINIFLLFLFPFFCAIAQNSEKKQLSLIPYPVDVETRSGQFGLNSNTHIVLSKDTKFENEASLLQSMLSGIISDRIETTKKESVNLKNVIEFKYDDTQKEKESYVLDISADKITIQAKDAHGAFNAIQTLGQLLPSITNQGAASLPALKIKDTPAFSWRGMHLDVSRHFFTIDYLKKHIDRLAYYKFNKFHLHLTDDQGWRIEIKKYPKLTEEGAWRTFNSQDSACIAKSKENPNMEIDSRFIREENGKTLYGGFYTQDQIKDLIKYAEARHIEIIPEIDMPGHMMAAINAYPYLVDGEVGWGKLFSTPICPCKEDVYTFSKNILSEIIELFPSKYIHIGADEVDKETWLKSDLCRKFMEDKGIEGIDKLQSYFVHEMQDFVESKGKKIIAWDEILEGGTNPNVTVMYWRGWVKDAPRKAVEGGSEVIMTPTNPLYFDYANNNTSVYNVYHMDVIPQDVPTDKAYLIQGAQANLWTEMIPSEAQAEFQMYPRMLALAERVWTNNTKNYDDFAQRLLAHYPKMDAMGINYRLPDIEGFAQENVYVNETDFMVNTPLPDMKIRYTLDGSIPAVESKELSSPVKISEPSLLKMALFSPSGVRGEIYTLNFKPTILKKAAEVDNLKSGLSCGFYDKYYKNTKEIQGEANEVFTVPNVQAPKETASFGLKLKGYIDVPETGVYSFFFTCDDGGVLYVNGEVVVDNDGQHSSVLKSGQAALGKGLHAFDLDFLEAGGGYTLQLQYSFNNGQVKAIPDSWFKH